jgi:hypothetical protein
MLQNNFSNLDYSQNRTIVDSSSGRHSDGTGDLVEAKLLDCAKNEIAFARKGIVNKRWI